MIMGLMGTRLGSFEIRKAFLFSSFSTIYRSWSVMNLPGPDFSKMSLMD